MDVSQELTNRSDSRQRLGNFLAEILPERLALKLAQNPGSNVQLANLSTHQIEAIGERINNWRVEFKETEGYDRAEVTLGGVSTAEISSQTFEAKKAPGLYFIGEVLDVTGWLGGYNFQWAWASGDAAGKSI
jgi:predicted Rossmann fold flavoprotein